MDRNYINNLTLSVMCSFISPLIVCLLQQSFILYYFISYGKADIELQLT
jgi:hypothetical protein